MSIEALKCWLGNSQWSGFGRNAKISVAFDELLSCLIIPGNGKNQADIRIEIPLGQSRNLVDAMIERDA
jgi:hypothetical protein